MRSADTNVVVRTLVRDDPVQASQADEFVLPGAWVSHVVVAETAWALEKMYGRAPGEIADAVGMLLEHASITVEGPDVVAAALAGFRARPRVGFPDHLSLEIARRAGHLPLGTFDRPLGKLDGAQAL